MSDPRLPPTHLGIQHSRDTDAPESFRAQADAVRAAAAEARIAIGDEDLAQIIADAPPPVPRAILDHRARSADEGDRRAAQFGDGLRGAIDARTLARMTNEPSPRRLPPYNPTRRRRIEESTTKHGSGLTPVTADDHIHMWKNAPGDILVALCGTSASVNLAGHWDVIDCEDCRHLGEEGPRG
jgi:hypothetical protein